MKPLVHLDKVTKDYRRLRALDQVSLTIGTGVTGLLGPNGAGKTTLIKVLLGLVQVTKGSGEVLGFELGRQARAIRDKVGYMPEDDCYISGLTGVETVQFAARLSGLPKLEALRRSHEILDFCGIEQERYRVVNTYSTGMRQKLKFAQAIVHDPPFLVLDEPTAGLDPQERVAMLNRIRVLASKADKAVIISTHILPDVQATCETVTILGGGRVLISERLDALNRPSSPSFTVRILGDPELFAEKIRQSDVKVEVHDDGKVRVEGDSPELPQQIWEWARQTGVGIRSLVPAQNTLEEVFLNAVREDRRAHS